MRLKTSTYQISKIISGKYLTESIRCDIIKIRNKQLFLGGSVTTLKNKKCI